MGQNIPIQGLSQDDQGNFVVDADSPFGQLAQRVQGNANGNNGGGGGGPNVLQMGAGIFQAVTSLFNANTVSTLEQDLQVQQQQIDAQNVAISAQIVNMQADASVPKTVITAFQQQLAVNQMMANANADSVQLADLQRSQDIYTGISGGIQALAGYMGNGSGGGGGGGGGSYIRNANGDLVPFVLGGVAGYALGSSTSNSAAPVPTQGPVAVIPAG